MTKNPKAQRAREDKSKIVFFPEKFGPQSYLQIRSEIYQAGLYLPQASSIAGLVCTALVFQNTPEFEAINYVLNRSFLCVFNVNIWTPEGVYVIDDSSSRVSRLEGFLEISKLEEELKSGEDYKGVRFNHDGSVRFAPRDTYTKRKRIETNGLIIASYGIKSADLLSQTEGLLRENGFFRFPPVIERVDVSRKKEGVLTASSIEVGYEKRLVFHGDVVFDEKNHALALVKPEIRKRADLKNPANT